MVQANIQLEAKLKTKEFINFISTENFNYGQHKFILGLQELEIIYNSNNFLNQSNELKKKVLEFNELLMTFKQYNKFNLPQDAKTKLPILIKSFYEEL